MEQVVHVALLALLVATALLIVRMRSILAVVMLSGIYSFVMAIIFLGEQLFLFHLTGAAFVIVGAVPLVPYVMSDFALGRFEVSCGMTLVVLFGVGASRAMVTTDSWWLSGLEMLLLGVAVAGAAYGAGAVVADWVGEV